MGGGGIKDMDGAGGIEARQTAGGNHRRIAGKDEAKAGRRGWKEVVCGSQFKADRE